MHRSTPNRQQQIATQAAAARLRATTHKRSLDAADSSARQLRDAGDTRNLQTLREAIQCEAERQDRLARYRAAARQLDADPIRQAIVARYQECEVDADPALRTVLRRIAGSTVPSVHVVWGADRPTERGEGHYHVTPATWRAMERHGVDDPRELPEYEPRTIITANCYDWPKVYIPSTRRVEVGVGYLAAHLDILTASEAA